MTTGKGRRSCARSRKRYVRSLALWVFLSASGAALAQGSSVLTGTVVDTQTRQPLANVVVTATGAALQGEQMSVTDSSGLYRIPQLPPGRYTLRFDLEPYQPLSRTSIDVPGDRTLRFNVELFNKNVELGTTIVVIGTAPIVDVGSSSTITSVGQEHFKNLPLAPAGVNGVRGFESMALLAPQTQPDTFGVSMNGTTSPENSYLVDGLSFNSTARGRRGSDFSVEFLDELNVITGGYLPEFGRSTGGVQSLTTKSGSNEFHGSVFGSWTPGVLAQAPTQVVSAATPIRGKVLAWNAGDFGATLGGYLVKDKLWFFAGFNPSFSRNQLVRSINAFELDDAGKRITDANGNARTTALTDATQKRYQDGHALSYIGKLTFLGSDDERLNLSVTGSPAGGKNPWTTAGGAANVNGAIGPRSSAFASDSIDSVLRLNSAFLDKKLLFDTSVGWHHATNETRPRDFSTNGSGGLADVPQVVWSLSHPLTDFENLSAADRALCGDGHHSCNVSGYRTGGAFVNDTVEDRFQGKLIGTLLLQGAGHHIIKAGLDVDVSTYDNLLAGGGGHQYVEVDQDTLLDNNAFGYLAGPDQPVFEPSFRHKTRNVTVGGFVQDSWSIFDRVTLNAGVRYDVEKIYASDGTLGLDLPNEWSPRLGLIWDFTGNGKGKLFANYARYYEQVPLDIADRALSGNETLYAYYGGCGDPSRSGKPCHPSTLLANSNGPNTYWSALGADREVVDPKIVPQSSDEVVAGAEYQLLPNGRAAITYTHRRQNEIIEDMSNNEAATYFLGNPGRGIAAGFPKPQRDYDAVTASFTKTFTDFWMAQASYTWSRLYGNWEGLFRSEDGQLDPNINSTYDLAKFLVNQTGPLSADQTHQVKVYVAKVFPISSAFSVTLGGDYNGVSGHVFTARGGDAVYGANTVDILPRGSLGRSPFIHTVDGHVSADLHLSASNTLTASADVFNLIGSQEETSVDQSYVLGNTPTIPIPNGKKSDLKSTVDPRTGAPVAAKLLNPNFLRANAYQNPRSVRFGVKLSF